MTTPALAVKCDRWEECQRQIAAACERLDCPHREQHPLINGRLDQLERRETVQDAELRAIEKGQSAIQQELAGIRGEIRGALGASRISGSVIGGVITAAISLGGMLLVRR